MRGRIKTSQELILVALAVGLCIWLVVAAVRFVLPTQKSQSNQPTAVWSQYPSPQVKSHHKQELKPDALKKPQHKQSEGILSSLIKTPDSITSYKPNYIIAWANSSNYGERVTKDVNGVPVKNKPIIVLHETSASASSAVNTFQVRNTDQNLQASYHTLIALDGTVVYIVPPDKRAYGAGNSVFEGSNGLEAVQTNPKFPPSVNNFAYHVSLETPVDGWEGQLSEHSGYTENQYKSLAWLIAQSSVSDDRITTHRDVDRSGQRIDPRSFDLNRFLDLLHSYRQASAIQFNPNS